MGSSSHQGSTGEGQKDAWQQLGPAWESYLSLPLGQSQEVPFYGENFYTEIHLNSEERVRARARARLTALEELKLLEFFPPRRFSEPTGNQLALVECQCPSLLPPALTLAGS